MSQHSIFHFLQHFPWRYYLSGGLLRGPEPVVGLFLSAESSAAMVVKGRTNVRLETNVASLPGSPPVPGLLGTEEGLRSFSRRLLARCRVKGSPRFVVLPDLDLNDFYWNMHGVTSLREATAEELLESLHEDPRQVLGSWEETRPFRWAVFAPDLRSVAGTLHGKHERISILGLPEEYCGKLEQWVDDQEGALLAIIPASFACFRWFLENMAKAVTTTLLVAVSAHSATLAVLQEGQVTLLRQFVEDLSQVGSEIASLAREFDLPEGNIFVWPFRSEPFAENLAAIPLKGEVLEEIIGSAVSFRQVNGFKTQTNEPVPHLLHWACHQMA